MHLIVEEFLPLLPSAARNPSARVSYTDCPSFFAQPKFPNTRSVVVNRCKFRCIFANTPLKENSLSRELVHIIFIIFIFQIFFQKMHTLLITEWKESGLVKNLEQDTVSKSD